MTALGLGIGLAAPAMRGGTFPIVAWGDSLTRGTGASGGSARYPAAAASLFPPRRDIVNRGIGGQTSTQIAARQGGVPILVTVAADQIPAAPILTWDWAEGTDGWITRAAGDETRALLSVDAGDLIVTVAPGSSQTGAQVRLVPLSTALPAGTTVTVRLDIETAASVVELGILNTGNSGVGGSWAPGGEAITVAPGKGITHRFTMSGATGTTFLVFTHARAGTYRIGNASITMVFPATITSRSVDPLVENGVPTGSLTGTLAGIHGTMATDGQGNWTFMRTDAGPASPCPPDTPFLPDDAAALRDRTNWIWAGRNNNSAPETVKADIAAMAARLDHDRYLVAGILNAAAEITGSTAHGRIATLNADLATAYGERFVDLRAALIAAGDPVLDAADIANDIVPGSLRSDTLHLNDAGYAIVAREMHEATLRMGW